MTTEICSCMGNNKNGFLILKTELSLFIELLKQQLNISNTQILPMKEMNRTVATHCTVILFDHEL